ncbi:MAG: hypothetical protein ACLFWD_02230 [Anaerolineales bacterium]
MRSSELSEAERIRFHDWLGQLPEELAGRLPGEGGYQTDTFRGDSWQILVLRPGMSLRIVLFLRAWLRANYRQRKLQARIGVGVGRHELRSDLNLASEDGPAFRRAGTALEASYRGSRLQVRLPSHLGAFAGEAFQAQFTLLDELSSQWTQKQAQALLGGLMGLTQEQTGNSWPEGPISQQAIAQHWDRAGWTAIEEALEHFEAWLPRLLLDPR